MDYFTHQYFSLFTIAQTNVEISTVEIESRLDIMETFGRGPWEHYSLIALEKYNIPVVNLELRLITEVLRGRKDRIDPILKHLKQKGFNKGI